jgi:hydrogenase small subunit
MRHGGSRSRLPDALAAHGVSRRDFLRFCGSLAASIGLSQAAVPTIAEALEQGTQARPAVWLSMGLCTGCTDSVAQSTYPDLGRILLELLSIDYWDTLAAGAGGTVRASLLETIGQQRGKFVLIVEGAVMKGFDGNTLRVAGRPAIDDLKAIADAAAVVLAVGSCAVDGGWVRSRPDLAGGTGVMDVVDPSKVVNLPTCPVNPEWVVAMIVDYLLLGRTVPVDDTTREPPLIYGQTIHDDCGRRGHFENGEFVTEFGSTEAAKGFCLYQMGCKGPQTRTRCPVTRWNSRTSWCVEAGSPCIGCANRDWVETDAPFLERRSGFQGVTAETIGAVLGGAALAGIVVHGIAQTATGRMGHGGPPETPEGSPAETLPSEPVEETSEEASEPVEEASEAVEEPTEEPSEPVEERSAPEEEPLPPVGPGRRGRVKRGRIRRERR